jgi:hypothetical protein
MAHVLYNTQGLWVTLSTNSAGQPGQQPLSSRLLAGLGIAVRGTADSRSLKPRRA